MKNLFVDIETSGLEPAEGHVPLAFGFLLDDGNNSPDYQHLIVTVKVTENQWALRSPRAIEINGFTWEQSQAGILLEEAKQMIVKWLIEQDANRLTCQYIGQNPKFDVKFLHTFMHDELEWVGFPWEPIDTITMARRLAECGMVRFSQGFSGKAIALALGVEPEDDLHTALSGILAVRRNYYALAARLGMN